MPAAVADGFEDALVAREEEAAEDLGRDHQVVLGAPVLGEAEGVDAMAGDRVHAADEADVVIHDAVGQFVDLRPVVHDVHHAVLKAVQRMHALPEEHEDRADAVLVPAIGVGVAFIELALHVDVAARVGGIGPGEVLHGARGLPADGL